MWQPLFASLAAMEGRPTRPVDDLESLWCALGIIYSPTYYYPPTPPCPPYLPLRYVLAYMAHGLQLHQPAGVGELCLRSLVSKDAIAAPTDADGWYRTGDLVEWLPDRLEPARYPKRPFVGRVRRRDIFTLTLLQLGLFIAMYAVREAS